ncbi:hypothetical protein MBLNU13_g00344t3 [Cladosporium sp. NU13]
MKTAPEKILRSTATALSTGLSDALKIWANSGPLLSYGLGGCDGYCFLDVPAAGFEFDCTEESAEPINYGLKLSGTRNSSSHLSRPANATTITSEETVFGLTFTTVNNNTRSGPRNASTAYSYIQADFIYTQAQDTNDYCPGVRVGITESMYRLKGMDSLYPGSYNSTLKQFDGYKVLNYTSIYEDGTLNGTTQLGGIVARPEMYLTGSATLELDDTAT